MLEPARHRRKANTCKSSPYGGIPHHGLWLQSSCALAASAREAPTRSTIDPLTLANPHTKTSVRRHNHDPQFAALIEHGIEIPRAPPEVKTRDEHREDRNS